MKQRKIRWSALLYAVITSVLLSTQAFGQTRTCSIELGGTLLSPGMSQEVVVAKLAEDFDVQKINEDRKNGTIWAVFHRPEKKGMLSESVGTLMFREGKLDQVQKDWTPVTHAVPDVEFARALYSVVSQFVREGNTDCTIDTEERIGPGGEVMTVIIRCGAKCIHIDESHVKGIAEGATIQEICCSKR